MKLDQWASRENLTYCEVASLIGRSPSVVYKWISGVTRPNEDGMAALYRLTRGEVTPTDFYRLPHLPGGLAPRLVRRRKRLLRRDAA